MVLFAALHEFGPSTTRTKASAAACPQLARADFTKATSSRVVEALTDGATVSLPSPPMRYSWAGVQRPKTSPSGVYLAHLGKAAGNLAPAWFPLSARSSNLLGRLPQVT